MKLVVFGLALSSSWGNGHATPYRAILSALARRGVDITFYEKDVEYYALRRDFSECTYCRLVLYSNWDQVREEAIRDCADADVVITASYVPEGARITDEVLELSRPLHVFYDLDTPITLKALENGGTDYLRKDQLARFDLYLSFTGGRILGELEQRYGAFPKPLYGCVDPALHHRVDPRAEFGCALSYMGTFALDRHAKLEKLFLEPAREMPESVFVLAGSMYPWEWNWPKNVRRIEHAAPADHPALYSSSGVTLNITRGEMGAWGYCPSGRFFEAAACATPIITDYFEGLETFFDLEDEVVVVEKSEEVTAVLGSSSADLQRMARRAKERTLEEHTGDRRAEQLIRYLQEIGQRTSHGRSQVVIANELEAAS